MKLERYSSRFFDISSNPRKSMGIIFLATLPFTKGKFFKELEFKFIIIRNN